MYLRGDSSCMTLPIRQLKEHRFESLTLYGQFEGKVGIFFYKKNCRIKIIGLKRDFMAESLFISGLNLLSKGAILQTDLAG